MRALKEELVINTLDECQIEIQNYQQILEDGLRKLDEKERLAIFLRFWRPHTIAQVGSELGLSWEAADKLIDRAVEKLREGFRKHKYYRRPLTEMEGI